MKDDWRDRWSKKISKMLPGDVIHDTAPTSGKASSGVRIEVIDEARVKRMKKLQRRAARAKAAKS